MSATQNEYKLRDVIDNKYLKIKTKKDRDTIDIEYFFLNPSQYKKLEKKCDKLIEAQKKKHREYERRYYQRNKEKILAKYHAKKTVIKDDTLMKEETMKMMTFYDTIEEEDDEIEGEIILI